MEAEAGPDLRELSVDDWDSALAEAGDTLVVVDFFTNWYISQLAFADKHLLLCLLLHHSLACGGSRLVQSACIDQP